MKELIERFATTPFLVTTLDWFTAPDGKLYKAVWGRVQIMSDSDIFGIKTNYKSSNWYAIIGEGDKAMVVAGCQLHYAVLSPNRPHDGKFEAHAGDMRLCYIYFAQGEDRVVLPEVSVEDLQKVETEDQKLPAGFWVAIGAAIYVLSLLLLHFQNR